jgi:hypothetical protein
MPASPPPEDDLATVAWLEFLARDMEDNPSRLIAIGEAEATSLEDLVKGVEVLDSDALPDNVTF